MSVTERPSRAGRRPWSPRPRAGRGSGGLRRPGHETEVRAYEGEVESLSSADSSGVGIRVLIDGKATRAAGVGFAWAGSLDHDVIAATLADARDNARFATPDPDMVLAAPDGVAAAELELWDDSVASTPTEKKVALAVELERRRPGRRPAGPPGVVGRLRRQPGGGGAGLDDRASRRPAAAPTPSCRSTPSPARAPTPRPAAASASGAGPATSIRTRRWTTPCCGRPGCSAPASPARGAARSSSTPAWCRPCSASSPPPCRARRS